LIEYRNKKITEKYNNKLNIRNDPLRKDKVTFEYNNMIARGESFI